MWEGYSLLGILVAFVLLVLDFYLLRRRKLQARAFVLWFIVGVVLAVFSVVPPLVSFVYILVGTELIISTVVVVGFLFFILVFFYLDYKISELRDQVMKLAMELSLERFSKSQGNPDDRKTENLKGKNK